MAKIDWEIDLSWSNGGLNNDYYRELLWSVIDSKGLKDGILSAIARGKVGNLDTTLWKEQETYSMLVDYLTLLMDEMSISGVTCNSDEYKAVIDSYNLDCVRSTFLCQYGNTGNKDYVKSDLLEVMLAQLDLCCDDGEGISLMNINNPTCRTFTIYPA